MTRKALSELLMLGEGQSMEFKTNFRLDAVGCQICAFLNSSGGYVVCGVNDTGEIIGLTAQVDLTKLKQKLSMAISPKALVSVELQEVDGKKILVFEVPAGKDYPYAFQNDIFIREGERTVKADVETIRDMVMRRQVAPERWERRFSSADPADLDLNEIHSIERAVDKTSQIQFRNEAEPLMVLEDLALSKYGRVTNGGDVLCGKNPALRYPQIRVRAVCFTSDKDDDTYRDMKSFEGPLVPILEQVFSFIMRNTPTMAHFDGNKMERQDESLYPPEAVREGLVNAFVHRDYADFSGGIAVHVYPKRLEIWNSGSFPEGVTPDTLATGHISVLRNPDIAHVLYLLGMMEKLGRGSVMIQKICTERELPKPEWLSEAGHGVTLTFFSPQKTGTPGSISTPEIDAGTRLGLSRDQVYVLRLTLEEQAIADIMRKVGRANRTKFRDQVLNPLLKAGLVEMTIPEKPTSSKQRYRITALGKKHLA